MRFLIVAVAIVGCAGGAILPFISPLLAQVAEYVLGETQEEEFIRDVVESVIERDPAKLIWSGSDELQAKYVLGTAGTRAVIDSTGEPTREAFFNPMTSLTFVGGVLSEMNDEDPDTVLVPIEPPDPPDPPGDDLLECLKDCLDLPPGQVAKCADACR